MSREKRGAKRTRSLQVSYLQRPVPITFSFLARHAKFSDLSGPPPTHRQPGPGPERAEDFAKRQMGSRARKGQAAVHRGRARKG